MATIILRSVGQAVAGPIGAFVGTVIGGAIDSQILGSPRRGPRLNDLSVQDSSYGAMIPQIYGTMRVAGSVIWATELEESEQVIGAKGQPAQQIYSYAANFAVLLSSRPAAGVGRIWADGKLLRGAEGDFKVPCTFRFHSGAQDQAVDPLIASIEGAAPAYRGCAMAVFEGLELAEYGNRIPMLTFEIFADASPVSLGDVVGEVSQRAIRIERSEGVDGYAAYGSSQADALSPLLELHDIALTSAAEGIGEIADEPAISIAQADLGAGSDEAAPRLERWSEAEHLLPAQLSVDHYDASRDYQQGRVTTWSGWGHRNVSIEAPMVLASDVARGMAEAKIARAFRERNRLTLRLPPRYSHVRPGQRVEIEGLAGGWRCIGVGIEQMVVELVLVPSGLPVAALPSDAGRLLDAPDVVASATSLALFDPPDFGQGPVASLMLAAANANEGWRAVPTDIMIAGQPEQGFTAAREAYLGFAENKLGDASGLLIDMQGEVVVQMVDQQHALLSLTDEDLLAGANLAMLGDELFQFGQADYLGSGRYRLSRLLRGRFGSEWACGGHVAGEAFCLVAPQRLMPIGLAQAQIGAEVSVKADGMADELTDAVVTIARGEALRPPSPVHLTATVEANGDVRVNWVRRSRAGYAWLDGSDSPMGETIDGYDLQFVGTAGSIARKADAQNYILPGSDVAALGQGELTISVATRGEHALSRPASITIQI